MPIVFLIGFIYIIFFSIDVAFFWQPLYSIVWPSKTIFQYMLYIDPERWLVFFSFPFFHASFTWIFNFAVKRDIISAFFSLISFIHPLSIFFSISLVFILKTIFQTLSILFLLHITIFFVFFILFYSLIRLCNATGDTFTLPNAPHRLHNFVCEIFHLIFSLLFVYFFSINLSSIYFFLLFWFCDCNFHIHRHFRLLPYIHNTTYETLSLSNAFDIGISFSIQIFICENFKVQNFFYWIRNIHTDTQKETILL